MKKLLIFSIIALMTASCSNEWYAENGFDDNAADSGNQLDSIDGIDESMYAAARIFPGLVDTTKEARIDTTIVLNLSYPYHSAKDLGLSYSYISYGNYKDGMPQPIYSTGVYAGAGELVTITLPEGNNFGLTAQIGMQTDDLSEKGSYLRQPIAYTRKSLYPGKNQLRFPLGGYIWLIRDHNAVNVSDLKVEIKGGVYSAPDYIYGKTNPVEWEQKVRTSTVPWMDIRGNRVTISVNRERIVQMMNSNPNFASELNYCLNFWDKMAEYRYRELGLRIADANGINRMPDFHDRFIFDVQLKYKNANYMMHTDNEQGTMMLQTTAFYNQLFSWDKIKKMEVDDVYETLMTKYRSFYSILNGNFDNLEDYIPKYRASQYFFQNNFTDSIHGMGMRLSEYVPQLLKYAEVDSAKRVNEDVWYQVKSGVRVDAAYFLLLTQINEYAKKYHGESDWEFLGEGNRDARLSKDFYANLFDYVCQRYAKNFAPLFDRMGIPLTDANRTEGDKYSLLREEVWQINPLKKTPTEGVGTWNGKWKYRVDRSRWNALATSKADYGSTNEDTDNEMTVANLFDNSLWTYWRNELKKSDAYIQLPYYVIIDMKQAQTLNGIYFANGGDRCVSHFKVQVMASTSDFELEDTENAEWKDWGEVNQNLTNSLRNEKFVEFSSPCTTRYLRLVFDRENLYIRPDEASKPTDAASFDKLHQKRYQRLAEFGVWHY